MNREDYEDQLLDDEEIEETEEEETEKTEEEETEETEEETEDISELPLFTKKDVSRMVSGRINSKNQVIASLKEDLKLVEEFCELTGLSKQELRSRLESLPAAEKAKLMGISADQVQARYSTSKGMKQLQETERKLRIQNEETLLKTQKGFEDWDDYKDEIDDVLERFPNMGLKEAYILAKSDDSVAAQAARMAEQRVIASKAAKAKKQVVKTGGVMTAPKKGLSAEEKRVAEMMGLSAEDYVTYQRAYTLDDVKKANKKKK